MKKALPIVVLLVVLLSVSLVFAQTGPPGSGYKSGQQVQNVGGATANVQLTAYDQTGTSFDCGSKSIAPGASETYLTDVDCPVPAGFLGSAVVSADQPIAAIVNVNNKPTDSAAAQYQGTDGADVATTINFPLVKSEHNGRTTTFYIQNASQSPNNISATFSVLGSTYNLTKNNVPANAMVVISPIDAGVPTGPGNVGSLVVTGTQPLAGTSLEHELSSLASGENLQGSKAFTAADGATTVFCPLVRFNHTDKNQTTGTQVQNVSGGPVDISYTVNAGGSTFGPFTETGVPNGDSVTFFMGDPSLAIPAGTVGSATVTATGNVVAVTNDKGVQGGKTRVTTYACFGSGGTSINVPLAKEHSGGNTTGIQTQNIGGSATKVQIEYQATNGNSLTIETVGTVAPGASVTAVNLYLLPDSTWTVVSGTPANMVNTVNGVVVSGTSDLAVIANESSNGQFAPASDQDTKNYEGFN